jgi:hypothetical protein
MRNENNAGVDLDRYLDWYASAKTRDEARNAKQCIESLIRASASQISKDAGGEQLAEQVKCLECGGTGSYSRQGDCSDCNGKGYYWEPIEAGAAAKTEQPGHETIVNECGSLVCTACGTSTSAAGAGSEQQGVKPWRESFHDTYPNFQLKDLKPSDALTWAEKEIANLRAAIARAPLPEQDDDARDAALTQAARDVLAERRRQVEVEGWTPEHDDAHGDGQMAVAAGYYALACGWPKERDIGRGQVPVYWPWAREWWKPRNKRTNLLRAAALILADIERIDRAAMSASRLDDKAAEHDHSEGGHHD